MTSYRGIVRDGKIVLDDGVVLPEGTKVIVQLISIPVIIEREGADFDEGIGFLPDRTMVIVHGAKHLIGQKVQAVIEQVLETSSGESLIISHVEGYLP